MSSKEFDVDQLAAYLHLTPPQVSKLASRGKLPGRRIGGQWRFPESEIHHWLEEKIGLSDSVELDKVEKMLVRNARGAEEPQALSEYMSLESIAIPLDARTRSSVIREMSQLAAASGLLWDSAAMAEAVLERENLHPTALENGVAMLHPRRPQASILAEPVIALGISYQPIPFGNAQGHLTDVFFLICSTDDRVHLRILARLSRLITEPEWLAHLRTCESPAEALDWIRQGEVELVANQT